MKISAEMVGLAAEFARDYLSKHLDEKFVYHDLNHTVAVVEGVAELCDQLQTGQQQKRVVLVAAWFHDLGYTRQIADHEKLGAELAAQFLQEQKVDKEQIAEVVCCILSTQYPQKPQTYCSQILCDADMIHLAGKDFFNASERLRKEWQLTKNTVYEDAEWYAFNIAFLEGHRYHTVYGQKQLESRKSKNLNLLKEKLKHADNNKNDKNAEGKNAGQASENKSKERPGRGVETLFRTASDNLFFGEKCWETVVKNFK